MYLSSIPDRLRCDSAGIDDVSLARALELLQRAHRYALLAGVDVWDFAVEIDEFRRAQVSNSDLRWLLTRQLAHHADEVSPQNGKRRFRRSEATALNDRSCFVIAEADFTLLESLGPTGASTPNGVDAVRKSSESGSPSSLRSADQQTPSWDARRRELRVGDHVVKRFRCLAPSQHIILDAFQTARWPTHIVDPLPLRATHCPKRRLHDAIKRLNRRHLLPAIRFCGDGSGRGVLWEILVKEEVQVV